MSRAPHPTHDGALASGQPARSLVTVHVSAHLITMVTVHVHRRRVHATVAADPTIRSADVGIGDGGGSRCAVPVGGPRDTPASEPPAPAGAALRPRNPSISACHERPSPALGKLRPARAPAYRPRQQNESPGRLADSLPGESPPLRSAPPSHSGGMTGRVGTPSRPVGAAYRLRHTSSMRRARVRHRSTLEAAPQPSSGTDR